MRPMPTGCFRKMVLRCLRDARCGAHHPGIPGAAPWFHRRLCFPRWGLPCELPATRLRRTGHRDTTCGGTAGWDHLRRYRFLSSVAISRPFLEPDNPDEWPLHFGASGSGSLPLQRPSTRTLPTLIRAWARWPNGWSAAGSRFDTSNRPDSIRNSDAIFELSEDPAQFSLCPHWPRRVQDHLPQGPALHQTQADPVGGAWG